MNRPASHVDKEPSDQALWASWIAGDDAAGRALLERFFPRVLAFFQTKVGEVAAELTQQTFLVLVERCRERRAVDNVRAFVFGIARIELLRWFERRGYGRGEDLLSRIRMADVTSSASRRLDRDRARDALLMAMRRLPVDAQTALELFYWEGLSVRDIGEVLGVSSGTVMSRLARAREKLRVELGVEAAAIELLSSF